MSVIFCGSPGCGKTTVAHIISLHTKCPFYSLSCCTASVDEIKEIADKADNEYRLRRVPSILFMDEIHRFNKKQQDLSADPNRSNDGESLLFHQLGNRMRGR